MQIDRPSNPNPVHERVFAGLKDEPLNFLTSSVGLVRLIERASRDDCTLDEISRLVQKEPLVAAKMVAMANSAAYSRGDRVISSVRDAMGLLGVGILKAVASAVAIGQLADRTAAFNERAVSRLWVHSVEVAALASVIARNFTATPPETALFAGIVHEIAGFYILSKADRLIDLSAGDVVGIVREDVAGQEEKSASVLAVGTRRLLAALQIPDEVVEAIDAEWRGYVVVPPETLGDVLMLANLMAVTPSPFDSVDSATTQASVEFDHVMKKSEVATVVQQAYEQVRSIQQAFGNRAG